MRFAGGVAAVSPGESATIVVSLPAGEYALVCSVLYAAPDAAEADGARHFALGMLPAITIGGDENEADLPDPDIEIVGPEYSFDVPAGVTAAEINIRFTDRGREPHDMTLVRLPDGVLFQTFVEGVERIPPGASQVATLDLEQDRYVLLCFTADAEGAPHASLGMTAALSVE